MSINLDFDITAFDLQFDAVFGRHLANNAYPEDALFGMNLELFFRAGWKCPLADEDAVRNLAFRYGNWANKSKHLGTHYRVAPLHNRDYGASIHFGHTDVSAGKQSDAIALPCLVMDFDTEDGKHAAFTGPFEGFRHPTRQDIDDLIADVMPDTFRTNTGGGIQSVFALSTPMDAQDPAMKALRQRFQDRWAAAARERGFGLDLSVGVKVTQTQRMAGSINWKREDDPRRVTVLKEDDGTVYSIDQLLAEMPEPVREVRSFPKGKNIRSFRGRGSDAFAANVPVSFLMQQAWFMDERVAESDGSYGRWTLPREDGTYGTDTHASTVTSEKGIQLAFAHGARLQGVWGVESSSSPMNSWDLLLVACGFNKGLAETVASSFQEPDEDLAETVRNLLAAQELAA